MKASDREGEKPMVIYLPESIVRQTRQMIAPRAGESTMSTVAGELCVCGPTALEAVRIAGSLLAEIRG